MGKTEKELADAIARKLKLKRSTGRKYLQLLLSMVRDDLRETGRSELRGLGTFAVHSRPARDTFHPKTGEPVHIAEHRAIRFRASKELKEQINKPAEPPPKPKKAEKRKPKDG